MNRNIQLLRNTLIILFGKVCTQLLSYLLLPMYTSVLSTQEYGTADLLLTYITLLAPVSTVQLENAAFRFLVDARSDPQAVQSIVSNVLAGTICVTIPVCAVYMIAAGALQFEYFWLFLLCVLCSGFCAVQLQIARGLGDTVGYAAGSTVTGILTLVLNILLVAVWHFGVAGMLFSTAAAQGCGGIFLFIREKIYKSVSFSKISWKEIRGLLCYSFPLVPNGLSWWVISASDRTVLSVFMGAAANGLFAVATKFSAIVVNVFSIFNLSWTESIALHMEDDDRDTYISDVTNRCITIFAGGCFVLIAAVPFVFDILIGDDFAQAFQYIPGLVIGSILNIIQTLYGIIYIGKKQTKKVSKSATVAAAVNILVDLLLVKFIGIYAAVVSTILAMLYLLIYRYRDINKTMRIVIDTKAALFLSVCGAAVVFLYQTKNTYLQAVGLAGAIAAFLYVNRDIIWLCIQKIKKKFIQVDSKRK